MTVYYAVDDRTGLIKIGTTARDPYSRAAEVNGRLLATEPGSYGEERQRHAQFDGARAYSEWFSPTPDLLGHIDALGPPGPRRLTAAQQAKAAEAEWRAPATAAFLAAVDQWFSEVRGWCPDCRAWVTVDVHDCRARRT